MKSIAQQSQEELGGTRSILVRQRRDHAVLERLLDQLPNSHGGNHEFVLRQICRLVFSHAFAEEAVLWPALRQVGADGEGLTAQVEREHQQITELVSRLDNSNPQDPGRDLLLEQTIALLRQDVRDEEDELLPRLQAALTSRQLRRIGLVWELVRRTAPTRAHPIVARRPPGNVLAALPLSLIDRSRDGLDRLAIESRPHVAARFLGASNALGSLSVVIEQMPPLRRGERPETHVSTDERGET
jgi:hypothetical protein